MKTSLKNLELKGFRSFAEPTSLALPESGLVLFTGPSGSGKSSIFLSIAHALGYCPYTATDLQSWIGTEKLEVKLDLETDKGPLKIVRGPKSFVEGFVKAQGASNIVPTIEKATGLHTDLLAALTYRPQGSPGLFLSKTNAEMQEFLCIVLGLDKFDLAIEQSTQTITNLSTQRELVLLKLPNLKGKVDVLAAKRIPDLQSETEYEERIVVAEELLETAKSAYYDALSKNNEAAIAWDQKEAAFKQREAKEASNWPAPEAIEETPEIHGLGNVIHQAEMRLERLQQADSARLKALRSKMLIENKELDRINQILKSQKDKLSQAIVLKTQIQQLKDSICPRCEQPWKSGKAEADLLATETALFNLETEIQEAGGLQDKAKEIEESLDALDREAVPDPKIAQMQEIRANANAEMARLCAELKAKNEQAVQEWRLNIQKATANIVAEKVVAMQIHEAESKARAQVLNALNMEVAKAQLAFQEAQHKLESVKKDNEWARKEAERLTAEKAEAESEHEQAQTKLDLTERLLREEQDLLELLKAFLTAIYDEVLEEVAFNTNEMLAMVPNVSHVTIHFKSETTTQKGNIKRAITPVININGGERPLRSALSGGMMSAVELAVDLAVRKVISARSGAMPKWLILDECFEGLGPNEKEACLGLLKQAAQDTLILVIDHSSETKELFSSTVTVENINGCSYISQN